MNLKKNNAEANAWRMAGNRHYKSTRFVEALVCYNKSLCLAVPGSMEFSLAFANRSAVYMELKEFEICLENIKLAIDCGYPEDRVKTLIEREEKCRDQLELLEPDPHQNPWTFFKLSHPANNKLPFIIDCIELRESKRFGRHLVTTRALKAGDVVCIEEPFHKFIFNDARFTHCANCLKCERLNLFPCCECNYTMFCSKVCMTIGARFHKLECHDVDLELDEEGSIFQMNHRVVFEAIGMFSKIEKLQKFLEDQPPAKTVFDFNLSRGDDNLREKNLLVAVNCLQRNELPDGMEPLMEQHVELMQSITKNPKNRAFLEEFMRKQMEIVITNTFGIGRSGQEIGSGIFPLASLFNHSCAPNITRVTVDNKLVFVVSRPIAKNQQLFVCYRSNFFGVARPQRQAELLTSYRFKCSCEACTKNYPLLENLLTSDESFSVPSSSFTSVESAKDEYKANCAFIDKHSKLYPNIEICSLIGRNQSILEHIAHVASLLP